MTWHWHNSVLRPSGEILLSTHFKAVTALDDDNDDDTHHHVPLSHWCHWSLLITSLYTLCSWWLLTCDWARLTPLTARPPVSAQPSASSSAPLLPHHSTLQLPTGIIIPSEDCQHPASIITLRPLMSWPSSSVKNPETSMQRNKILKLHS